MSEERHQRVEAIFQGALEVKNPSARAAYVRYAAEGDEGLIEELERLLAADDSNENLVTGAALGDVETEAFGGEMGESLGSMVGPYKLLQQIGEGGFGVVYMAEQEKPVRRRVALKIIKSGMDTKQVVARFEAERQALAMMDHSNIARVFDGGETELGRPYFVMELVRGLPITEYCDEQKLSTEDRLYLFMDVCSAVQHAHQKGIIHRDLKPSNVLITVNDGRPVPKVIDFGIAKATEQKLTDKTLFTRMEQAIGTPDYMSPEQAGMSSLDVDTRSDVYSLGVMLYVLLTGEKPFDWGETSWDEIKRRLKEEEPQKPSTKLATIGVDQLTKAAQRRRSEPGKLGTQLKGDLDWIVMKAMEKDRERRYETANAFRLDIRRFLDGELVMAVAPSLGYRWSKFINRNRKAVVLGGAIALALVVATVISSTSASVAIRKSNETAEALLDVRKQKELAEENAHELRVQTYAADMRIASAALANNNRGLAKELVKKYQGSALPELKSLRGYDWRYLWARVKDDPHVTLNAVTAPKRVILDLVCSPTESWVAVYKTDGTIDVVDYASDRLVATLRDLKVYDFGLGEKLCSFSPDGSKLAAITASGKVGIWKTRHWSVLPALTLGSEVRASGSFSPDGESFVTMTTAGEVIRFDLESSGRETLLIPEAFVDRIFFRVSSNERDLVRLLRDSGLKPERVRRLEAMDLSSGNVIWSRDASIEFETTDKPGDAVSCFEFSPTGKHLYVGTWHSEIFVYDMTSGDRMSVVETEATSILDIAVSPSGDRIAAAYADQRIRIWATETMELLRTIHGHNSEVFSVEFSADGSTLISGDKLGLVKRWSVEVPAQSDEPASEKKERLLITPTSNRNPAGVPFLVWGSSGNRWVRKEEMEVSLDERDFAYASRAHAVAYGTAEGRLEIYDFDKESVTQSFLISDHAVSTIGVSLSGRFAVVERNGHGEVWDLKEETVRFVLGEGYRSASFSSDDRLVAASNLDFGLRIWDVEKGEKLHSELKGERHMWRFEGLTFSSSGKWLASHGLEESIRVWDVEKGELEWILAGHTRGVSRVRFSRDESTLISASVQDRSLRMWNLATGRETVFEKGPGEFFLTEDQGIILRGRDHDFVHWITPSIEVIDRMADPD